MLEGLDGRSVGTGALFDALKLEVLDWRLDHGVDVEGLGDTSALSRIVDLPPEEEATR